MIVWHLDRLYRRPGELEQLLDLLDTRPIRIEAVQGGLLDLNRHEGRLFARQLVAFANYESAHRGARVTRAQQQRARSGAWHGHAAYGYRAGGALDARQVPVLHRIVRDYLAGCSETEIARRLNADRIATPGSSDRWHPSTVQSILRSDRLHRHRKTDTGEIVTGVWEPVITNEESALVRALQLLPQRRTTNSSRSLLGGLARCAVCDRTMVVHYSGIIRRYICLRRNGGCGIGIAADLLDQAILKRIATNQPAFCPRKPAQELAQIALELQDQQTRNAAAFGGGERDYTAFAETSRTLQTAVDDLSGAVVARTPAHEGDRGQLPLPELRRLIQQRNTSVWIEPSQASGKFDPSRLRIQWRTRSSIDRS